MQSNTEYKLVAFFHQYKPEWKRMTFSIIGDEDTENILENLCEKSEGMSIPICNDKNQFYVKHTGAYPTIYYSKNREDEIPTDQALHKYITIYVTKKTYAYMGKFGWYFVLNYAHL